MKRMITVLAISMSALGFSAAAVSDYAGNGYIDKAKVIRAEPIYETIEVAVPVTECWNERVTRNERNFGRYAAPLAGGVIGGVVGNELGRGRGKTALTIAGTLLGASVGHNFSNPPRSRSYVESVRRCETVDHYEQEQQLVGYHVKYRYKGQTFMTRTGEHPGKFIRVHVNVDPVERI